jgi:thioredoxin 1
MAEIREVNDNNFEAEILKSDKPSIVDFWAEWCAPCRAISPIIKELAEKYGDRVNIVKMNIEDAPQTPGTYGVRAIPTILAFKDGVVVEQLQGARPKADFKAMAEKLLS